MPLTISICSKSKCKETCCLFVCIYFLMLIHPCVRKFYWLSNLRLAPFDSHAWAGSRIKYVGKYKLRSAATVMCCRPSTVELFTWFVRQLRLVANDWLHCDLMINVYMLDYYERSFDNLCGSVKLIIGLLYRVANTRYWTNVRYHWRANDVWIWSSQKRYASLGDLCVFFIEMKRRIV